MKEIVKRNFSLAAKSYSKYSLFQRIAGGKLLKRISFFNVKEPILDLGSGTGELLNGKNFLCLDISFKMAELCRERALLSICGDAEELPLKSESVPTAVSNFSLQWTELNKSIPEVYRVLKKGGLFFLSIPVEGSLRTLFSALRVASDKFPTFKFPEEKEVFEVFSRFFDVLEFERLYLERKFKSAREAVKFVTGIGAKNPFGSLGYSERKKFRDIFNREPKIEYRVLIISGRKLPKEL
jgi:malonyl-CoA O-methyltransferase